jgi:predicted amidohydrolase
MKNFRVALAQLAPRLGDLDGNLTLHLDALEKARGAGARVVVFPELSLTGYRLLDRLPEVALSAERGPLRVLRNASREIDMIVGFVEEGPDHRFYNSAAYLSGGGLLHVHRKLFLPTYGAFAEGRDFARGERLRIFDSPFGPCGILICEDLWHPTCGWLLALEGAETIFVLSNGPTRGTLKGRTGGVGGWGELVRVAARLQTTYVVYANRVGCEEGLTFGGSSMVADPFGRVVVEAPPLEEGLVYADLEGEALRRARISYPLLRDEDLELFAREFARIRRVRFGLQAASEIRPVDRSRAEDPT